MDTATGARAVDALQHRLSSYACAFDFSDLAQEDVHAMKQRVIDTFGALLGGFFSETCQISRNLAARMPCPDGATVIGTRNRTPPDMAAFVNSTTSREVEMNDVYFSVLGGGAHPSDVTLPILAAAEGGAVSGRELVAAVTLAYEVYMQISDATRIPGFDQSVLAGLGTAIGAAKVMRLPEPQMQHAISLAIVPNNALIQTRRNHLSMWKAAAAGQAGRAGVFAAMLAREGMEGPHLPFEGAAGWFEHIARTRVTLDTLGGRGVPFRVRDAMVKSRAACAAVISSILAAEAPAAQLGGIDKIEKVLVETYAAAKNGTGTGEQRWNPQNRETADHSIPYVVAATLMDGTVGPRQFRDDRLWNPELRALIQRVEVVANDAFTNIYQQRPPQHHTRVTVQLRDGNSLVGEAGGPKGDMANPPSDREVEEKFRLLAEDYLGPRRVRAVLDRLWALDEIEDVSVLPGLFVIA